MASSGFDVFCSFGEVFSPNQINIIFFLTIDFNRGGKANEKFPVQPSNLVLIHNNVVEALAKPDTDIRIMISGDAHFQT